MLWVLKRTLSIWEREKERERERERVFCDWKQRLESVLHSMEITESFDALYTIKLDFFYVFHIDFRR